MKKSVMTKTEIQQAKRRLAVLEKQLPKTVPLMRGNIVTNGVKHRQPYFSVNRDRRTHLMYLGEKRLPLAQKMSGNYKRLLEIVEEMTMLNMALLKNDEIS